MLGIFLNARIFIPLSFDGLLSILTLFAPRQGGTGNNSLRHRQNEGVLHTRQPLSLKGLKSTLWSLAAVFAES